MQYILGKKTSTSRGVPRGEKMTADIITIIVITFILLCTCSESDKSFARRAPLLAVTTVEADAREAIIIFGDF